MIQVSTPLSHTLNPAQDGCEAVETLRQIARHTAYLARAQRDGGTPAIPLIEAERERLIARLGAATRIDDRGDRWLLVGGVEYAFLGYLPACDQVSRGARERPRVPATGWRSRLMRRLRSIA